MRERPQFPTRKGRRPAAVVIRYATAPCALGQVLVATTERGICAIGLADDPATLLERLREDFPGATLEQAEAESAAIVGAVIRRIENPAAGPDLPLDIRGTAFQRRVWDSLREIPPGTTVSYLELARRIGNPRAARAVARACAGNRLAVAIPCHRVVGSDGALHGYRWGMERKRALLQREAAGETPEDPRGIPRFSRKKR